MFVNPEFNMKTGAGIEETRFFTHPCPERTESYVFKYLWVIALCQLAKFTITIYIYKKWAFRINQDFTS